MYLFIRDTPNNGGMISAVNLNHPRIVLEKQNYFCFLVIYYYTNY